MSTQDNGTGGKYRVGRAGPEEISDESSDWSGEDAEELASEEEEEEAKTAGGGQGSYK